MIMIKDNLIQECSCGETKNFSLTNINDIPLLICTQCGVPHQYLPGWKSQDIVDFYSKKYHSEEQIKIGLREYKNRYDHDFQISNLRLNEYKDFLWDNIKGLDIGSSNSAFVHAARAKDFNFIGIDPGCNIGDDNLTIRSVIQEHDFKNETFDIITMHDSLEHMVEVRKVLKTVSKILNYNGTLIIDLPDYYIPEGRHHWRPIQHLWYWNKEQMVKFLLEFGLSVIKITTPIPGKLVFYAKK